MSFFASLASDLELLLGDVDLPLLGHAHDADEGLERGLVVAEVDVAPPLLVDGVGVDAGLRELLDLLVELEGVLHLALVEVVLGERQVRVRDVLRVRVVLDQAVEELARLVFLLHAGEQVGEAEQHLVHALVLPELGRADVRLHRLEQPLLLLLLVGLLLRLQRAALVGRQLEDLLIERARLAEVEALLLGVELAEAEQEVRLLRIVVRGDRDQAAHLADLRVDDLLDLLRLRARGTRSTVSVGPRLLLGRRRRFGLGQVGLRRLDLASPSSCTAPARCWPASRPWRRRAMAARRRRQQRAKRRREDPLREPELVSCSLHLHRLHVGTLHVECSRRCRLYGVGRRHPLPRPATLAACGRGRRRALARRRRALGRVPLTLVADLDAVVAELVAPVLADERPDDVLVVGADVLDRLVAGPPPDRARAPR